MLTLDIWNLPEYILSSTRGTAQNTVGFSAAMSSTNSLTSYRCITLISICIFPKGRQENSRIIPHAKIQFLIHGKWTLPQTFYRRHELVEDMTNKHHLDQTAIRERGKPTWILCKDTPWILSQWKFAVMYLQLHQYTEVQNQDPQHLQEGFHLIT